MFAVSVSTGNAVKYKATYIKLIFLVDKKTHPNEPIFYRKLYRSEGKPEPIYDSAMFYTISEFAEKKPPRYVVKSTSSEGMVEQLQLHPFSAVGKFADPAENSDLRKSEVDISDYSTCTAVITHDFNGFQRGEGEWAGARADEDTSELRLVVDFSSIPTKPEKQNELFEKEPIAYWVHVDGNGNRIETEIDMNYRRGNVFSISQKNVSKNDIVKMKWQMAWDNLLTWHSKSNGTEVQAVINPSNFTNDTSSTKNKPERSSVVNISIGTMVGSTIQQGITNSQVSSMNQYQHQQIEDILRMLKEGLKKSNVDGDKKDGLETKIKTLEAQKNAKNPRLDRIKDTLSQITTLAEGIASFAPVIARIGTFLVGVP